jgi:hypothetical protein
MSNRGKVRNYYGRIDNNVQSNGGIGFPAGAIPGVIPLKLNVLFDCDLV